MSDDFFDLRHEAARRLGIFFKDDMAIYTSTSGDEERVTVISTLEPGLLHVRFHRDGLTRIVMASSLRHP